MLFSCDITAIITIVYLVWLCPLFFAKILQWYRLHVCQWNYCFESPSLSGDFYIGYSSLFLARVKIKKKTYIYIDIHVSLTARNAIKPSRGKSVKMAMLQMWLRARSVASSVIFVPEHPALYAVSTVSRTATRARLFTFSKIPKPHAHKMYMLQLNSYC